MLFYIDVSHQIFFKYFCKNKFSTIPPHKMGKNLDGSTWNLNMKFSFISWSIRATLNIFSKGPLKSKGQQTTGQLLSTVIIDMLTKNAEGQEQSDVGLHVTDRAHDFTESWH